MDLNGKVVIVTGASRGLGKAIAIGLAENGATILAVARTDKKTDSLQGTITDTKDEITRKGGIAHAIKCDVTDEAQTMEMAKEAIRHFGHLDALINNAGIAYPAPIWELPLKRWELVMKVNLTGAFLCSKAVLPEMIKRRSGSIINISSIQAGQAGSVKAGTVYGVSKAALERLTYGMAEELKPFHVAVNCLKPRGAVRTEGMERLYPDVDQSKWDNPDMMIKASIFLATQNATGVTGLIASDEEICERYRLL